MSANLSLKNGRNRRSRPNERLSDRAPPRRQGRSERTHQKIKDAVITLLNEQNYFDLTITDICRAANVATGGFYFHYEKKADLVDEVLREHSARFWADLTTALAYRDAYSAIFHASASFVRAFREAPGLVRCFNQMAMVDRAYVRLWEDAAGEWTARLAEMLAGEAVSAKSGPLQVKAYGILSFIDHLLFELYIDRDPALSDVAGSADEITENIAVLWYRALIGRSPPAGRLAHAHRGQGI